MKNQADRPRRDGSYQRSGASDQRGAVVVVVIVDVALTCALRTPDGCSRLRTALASGRALRDGRPRSGGGVRAVGEGAAEHLERLARVVALAPLLRLGRPARAVERAGREGPIARPRDRQARPAVKNFDKSPGVVGRRPRLQPPRWAAPAAPRRSTAWLIPNGAVIRTFSRLRTSAATVVAEEPDGVPRFLGSIALTSLSPAGNGRCSARSASIRARDSKACRAWSWRDVSLRSSPYAPEHDPPAAGVLRSRTQWPRPRRSRRRRKAGIPWVCG